MTRDSFGWPLAALFLGWMAGGLILGCQPEINHCTAEAAP